MTVQRQLLLKSRPEGLVKKSNFDLVEHALPALEDGQIHVKVLYISMDPTNRVWMSDATAITTGEGWLYSHLG